MKISNVINASTNMFNVKEKKEEKNFSVFLKDAIKKVNEYELNSQRLDMLSASGQIDNIHEVMIAAEKSEIALQFTIEVKNKVLDAYKEIMRLQV